MQKLRQQANEIRSEVCLTIEQKYNQYLLTAMEQTKNLKTKITSAADEIDRTKRKIDAQVKKKPKRCLRRNLYKSVNFLNFR